MDAEQKPGAEPAGATWGIDEKQVLADLRRRPVELHLQSGDTLTGVLVGYNRYWLTILLQAEPRRVLAVNKAAVAWLALAL
jgi:small nuclear ribonucleoprotein (snRNP)-like protein